MLLPSVAQHGGIDPEAVWSRHPHARMADPDGVNSVLAAMAGDWLAQSLRPSPANISGLRAHQEAKALGTLGWLRRRLTDSR